MTQKHTTPDGLVIVDKPSGFTSHDVVAKMRGIAKTRRVGHAGTLDPMATGVLVLGIERATKLLGHLALTEKEYLAPSAWARTPSPTTPRGRSPPPPTLRRWAGTPSTPPSAS